MHPNQTLRLIRLRTQRRPYRGIRRQVHFFLVSCTRATLTYYVLGSPSLYNAVSVRRVVAYARLYMVLMPCFFFPSPPPSDSYPDIGLGAAASTAGQPGTIAGSVAGSVASGSVASESVASVSVASV